MQAMNLSSSQFIECCRLTLFILNTYCKGYVKYIKLCFSALADGSADPDKIPLSSVGPTPPPTPKSGSVHGYQVIIHKIWGARAVVTGALLNNRVCTVIKMALKMGLLQLAQCQGLVQVQSLTSVQAEV